MRKGYLTGGIKTKERKEVEIMNKSNKKKNGFTLIELLAVVGILVALVGVILPIVFGVIDKSKIARVGVDIVEIGNGSILLFDDTGEFADHDSGDSDTDCDAVAVSNLVSNISGSGSWAGPYIDKEAAYSPWGVSYYVCDLTQSAITNIPEANCDDVAPYPSTIYPFVITLSLSSVSGDQSARQRIAERIDRNIDGTVSATSGKVRYPPGYTDVCIGFVGRRD